MPQDFSGQNLRGRSFKGQNLEGANFSGADIRGANFAGAGLKAANFSYVKAGLQQHWVIGLLVVSCLLSILSGSASASTGLILGNAVTFGKSYALYIGVITTLMFITFSTVIATQGLEAALGSWTLLWAIVGVSVGYLALGWNAIGAIAVVLGWAIVAVFAGVVAVIVAGIWILVLALAVALVSVLRLATSVGASLLLADIIAVAVLGLTAYVGRIALAGDERQVFFQKIALAIAATGGTSFRSSNLTDAKFTGAILKSTDFRKAVLTRTCFNKTNKLNRVRPGRTYLQNAKLRHVLVTGQGQEKNFDREDLRGVNFQGANLVDASFIGADLSQANLQDADLSRAKLVQTQLNGTDLTGATLTGAYIQDWGITTDTKFDGVRCEYVYIRLPTKENPDPLRKPDNKKEVFADGDFGEFIKPIFDTLDLYHNQNVDPRAIAISFKQLAENHPDAELEIVAMEKRGQNKFLLRAKTAAKADKSQLSAEYFEIYNKLRALAEQELKALIAEKDNRIRSLENMVVTALQSPKFYAENYNNQGDTMSQSPKKQSNFNLQGAQFAGGLVDAETVTAQQIGGNITNYNPEQRQNLAEAAAEIQQLLNQLGETYPTNTPLEKQIVVTEALKEIERNPTLKARVIGALKAGGTEALKELLDHPAVNVLLAALEGWQDAE